MRVCVCVHVCAHDVCLFGARPSGHPLTVNNEHGTYDRCVGDGGYTGCLAQFGTTTNRVVAYVCLKEQSGREERRRDEEKQSHPRSRVSSFSFLSPFLPFALLSD